MPTAQSWCTAWLMHTACCRWVRGRAPHVPAPALLAAASRVPSSLPCPCRCCIPCASCSPPLMPSRLPARALLLQGAAVADPQPATVQELLEFHSRPYLQALAAFERLSERQRGQYGLEDDCAPFPGCGRVSSCALLAVVMRCSRGARGRDARHAAVPRLGMVQRELSRVCSWHDAACAQRVPQRRAAPCRLYEHAALTAGGSLAAAEGLCSGRHRLAAHLDGARQQRSAAAFHY